MRADSDLALRLLSVAGLSLLTAACGGRGTVGSSAVPAAPTSSAEATPAATTPADSTSPTAAQPVPVETTSALQRCHAADVAVQFLPAQAATGHVFHSVAVHNTAGRTCTLYGYAGMLMLDATGHPLPTIVQRGGGMLGTPAPTTVTLPPMAIAYFELEYTDIQSGPSPCPTSSRVEVTPPDETGHVIVDTELAPCADGHLIITALHSGAPRA